MEEHRAMLRRVIILKTLNNTYVQILVHVVEHICLKHNLFPTDNRIREVKAYKERSERRHLKIIIFEVY